MKVVLSRKRAFLLAWHLFWLATGSKRIGMKVDESNTLYLFGDEALEREMRRNK